MFPAWRHAVRSSDETTASPEDPQHSKEKPMTHTSDSIPDAVLFGNRFVTQEVPSREFPETGMTAAGRHAAGG